MKNKLLAILAVGLLTGPMAASAITIDFSSTPTDTTYIGSGLLLGSSSGPDVYTIGGCGAGSVGCLGNDGAFVGTLTFTFVELGTTTQAVTDSISFIMCRGCAFRPSLASIFDPFGVLLTTIDLNTLDGVANRTFGFNASNIGRLVVNLGFDAVESITFGEITSIRVPEPGTLALFGLGLLGLGFSRRKKLN